MRAARTRGAGTAAVRLRATQLPFGDHSFDVVSADLGQLGGQAVSSAALLAEMRRVLRQKGTMHLAVEGWDSGALRAGRRFALAPLRGTLPAVWRLHRVLSRLRRDGFAVTCWARLPSHRAPRYLVECDDVRSLQFLLWRLPTAAQSTGRGVRLLVWLMLWPLGRWSLGLGVIAPGLSVVARAEGPAGGRR